jgi:hypothetical protein
MKKNAIFICIIITCAISFVSCKKSKSNTTDTGCGCGTDSSVYYATYNNFLGYSYNGGLVYYKNTNNQGAWYVGVNIPNTNYYGICKICNPDLPAITQYTDTSTRKNVIPILFAGNLKKLCPNEGFGLYTLPETVLFYITIDSLKKN